MHLKIQFYISKNMICAHQKYKSVNAECNSVTVYCENNDKYTMCGRSGDFLMFNMAVQILTTTF